MLAVLALVGAIVFEVSSTLGMQHSDSFRKKVWIAPVVVGYVVSYSLLAVSLGQGMPLGAAYAIWAASGAAITAVLSVILFKERFTWLMSVGIASMICGMALVELG
jgi:small multidrug resistance pump